MFQVVEAPSEAKILEIVSVEELKANERISHSRENDLLEGLILDAYSYLDGQHGKLRRPILDTKFIYKAATLLRTFEIPFPGVKAVESVQYWDRSIPNVLTPIEAANYEVTVDGLYATVRLFPSYTLPTLSGERFRAVEYTFTAGFGPDVKTVPRQIRRAMILLASHWYQHREATTLEQRITAVSKKIEFGVDELVSRFIAPLRMG